MMQRIITGMGLALAVTFLTACVHHTPLTSHQPNKTPLVWPKAPAEERIRFLQTVSGPQDWGITRSFFRRISDALSGSGEDHFVRPSAVAERAMVLYVADPGAQAVWILDTPNNQYHRITRIGGMALLSPVALALGPGGAVFVADTGLKKIFLIDRDGHQVRSFATQGLERPAGLAWDEATQRLFVIDSVRHRVVQLDAQGALLGYFGEGGSGNGQFNHPTHLALNAHGDLLVTDALNFRVQALDRQGHFLWRFGKAGNGSGDFSAPKGVAADGAGHVYVVDAMFDVVQIFDQQGQFLLSFGEHGGELGQFSLPGGIFISPEDKIFVADAYNGRVQIFLGAIATASAASPQAESAK